MTPYLQLLTVIAGAVIVTVLVLMLIKIFRVRRASF